VSRALVALGGEASTGQLIRFAFPRRDRFRPGQYERVRRWAAELGAVVAGRGSGRARPILWRLKKPIA
jgi:hypothetical protein